MTLNPILNGIQRGFDLVLNPGQAAALRRDIYRDHGETVYYDNHHELIEDTANFTAFHLGSTGASAYDFLLSVLALNENNTGCSQLFDIVDDHISQLSYHVSFLDELNQKQSAGKKMTYEHARCCHKLKANSVLIDDIEKIPFDIADHLLDHALQVDDSLIPPTLETSPIVSILKIAAITYDDDEEDAPKNITKFLRSYKIRKKYHEAAREMVDEIRDMLDMKETTLRSLFIASLEQDTEIDAYQRIAELAPDDTLLQIVHNFDGKTFSYTYDTLCAYDNYHFLTNVERMVALNSKKSEFNSPPEPGC
jgi:hypothetical protein